MERSCRDDVLFWPKKIRLSHQVWEGVRTFGVLPLTSYTLFSRSGIAEPFSSRALFPSGRNRSFGLRPAPGFSFLSAEELLPPPSWTARLPEKAERCFQNSFAPPFHLIALISVRPLRWVEASFFDYREANHGMKKAVSVSLLATPFPCSTPCAAERPFQVNGSFGVSGNTVLASRSRHRAIIGPAADSLGPRSPLIASGRPRVFSSGTPQQQIFLV